MPHRHDDIRPDLGLLALRLLVGAFMLFGHGLPKLVGWAERSGKFFDFLGIGPAPSLALAIFAEAGCSLLLMLGLYTRFATVPLLVTMFVAAFMANAGEGWAKQELAMMYVIAYVALLIGGPGRYSLDAMLARGRR